MIPGTAPQLPIRTIGDLHAIDFKWQDPPRRSTHLFNLEVHPALPTKRLAGFGGFPDARWKDAIVIDQGEPVGLYTDPSSGRHFIVPCVGGGDATVTYTDEDVEQAIEDLDNLGSPVASAGTSTAKLPQVLPIGLAAHPILRNFTYTTGNPLYSSLYDNYSPQLRPVVADDGVCEIPWFRHGPRAITAAISGALIVPAVITNISRTNRPFLTTANILSTAAGNATAANTVITVAVGNSPAAGEILTITHRGNVYTFTVVAASPDPTLGEFIVGADEDATAANLEAAILATIHANDVTVARVDNVVTVTSKVLGNEGTITSDATAMTDVSSANNAATDNNAAINAGLDANNAKNLAFVIGRLLQVRRNLSVDTDAPPLAYTRTTPGLGLAGVETGGVPQNFYVTGNTPRGLGRVPTDYSEAGALRIKIHV